MATLSDALFAQTAQSEAAFAHFEDQPDFAAALLEVLSSPPPGHADTVVLQAQGLAGDLLSRFIERRWPEVPETAKQPVRMQLVQAMVHPSASVRSATVRLT